MEMQALLLVPGQVFSRRVPQSPEGMVGTEDELAYQFANSPNRR